MARALMPGWERSPDWSEFNKVYISPGEYIEREPLKIVPDEERHTYEVEFDKTINLFVSPGDSIEITRIFEGNYFKSILATEYLGGINAWINNVLTDLCDANWDRTNFEVGGGFVKPSDTSIVEGLKACDIKVLYKKYTPPKPKKKKAPKDVVERRKRLKARIKRMKKQIEDAEKLIRQMEEEYEFED